MNCEQVKEYLNEYVDGFLPDEIKEQVEAHLTQCAACKKAAEALLKLHGEIRALKLEHTDDFVFDIERAKAPVVLPMRRKGWLRAISATAACFVLLIGVYTAVQNGYQTPAVQELSAGNADEASDIALASGTAEENKTKTRGLHTKTVPVSEDYTYRFVPEDVTPYSSVILDVEATEESQNAKGENFGEADMDTQEYAANAPMEDELPAPIVPDSTKEASTAQASSGASAGGGGSFSGASAVRSMKRTVTLAVSDEAKESFAKLLSGLLLSGFDGEAVINEADLQQLLYADGVTLVSDETAAADTDAYNARIVIRY